jgi:PhnB protein
MNAETEIRALIDAQVRALRAKDVDGTLAAFSADVVRFDLAPPLRHDGAGEATRRELAAWFGTWRGALGYETRDFVVAAAGDLAFAYGYIRISGTRTDGARSAVWARQTLGLRRAAGGWRIVHEHSSVPFLMDGSFKAAVDLAP